MIEIYDILDVEKYLDGIEVVIFDLDDTLYLEKDYVRSGYRKIADHFNIDVMEQELWNAFEDGKKAIDEVLNKYGLDDKTDEAIQIYRHQEPDIVLDNKINDMLVRIKKDKKVGIITDGRPEGQRAKIKALGLSVDKIIITDELGGVEYRKPNETAYIIMRDFFDSSYEKMVYIGDNIKKDFIAPEKLGMKSIWYRNPDGLYT